MLGLVVVPLYICSLKDIGIMLFGRRSKILILYYYNYSISN